MDFCSQLTLNLLIDTLKNSGDETNLIFSPLSYNIILNMIAQGASEFTLREMLQFLQCAEIKDVESNSMKMMGFASDGGSAGPVVQCLNGLWFDHHYHLKPSFQDSARNIYNAYIKSADFLNKADEVVEEANAWAKASSKGLVHEVLKHGELNGKKILLGNALYFKGFWKDGFNPERTQNRPFYLMNGSTKSVPFMTGCEKYSQRPFDGFKVVSIPYQTGEKGDMLSFFEKGDMSSFFEEVDMFSMYIFLPNDKFGLQSLLDKAVSDSGFLRQDFELYDWACYDSFWIPKFKFSYYTSKGGETMQKMGLTSPFDQSPNGLTDMVNGDISISKIVQKSFIEVDEKGTKAAAVTFPYGGSWSSGEPRKTKFIADHPFMFMIREERSKFILFTGVVVDPS